MSTLQKLESPHTRRSGLRAYGKSNREFRMFFLYSIEHSSQKKSSLIPGAAVLARTAKSGRGLGSPPSVPLNPLGTSRGVYWPSIAFIARSTESCRNLGSSPSVSLSPIGIPKGVCLPSVAFIARRTNHECWESGSSSFVLMSTLKKRVASYLARQYCYQLGETFPWSHGRVRLGLGELFPCPAEHT